MTMAQSRQTLVADCGGLVEQLAIALPTAFLREVQAFGGCDPLVPIGNLIRAMPTGIQVMAVVDDEALPLARRWVQALGYAGSVTMVAMDGDRGAIPGPWIQDMFHVRTTSGDPHAAPEILSSSGNGVGTRLAERLNLAATGISSALAGGNQLVGHGFRLIGHSDLVEAGLPVAEQNGGNSSILHELGLLDDRQLVVFGYRSAGRSGHDGKGRRLARPRPAAGRLFGVPVDEIALSGLHQYGFHVDQFVTVTGLNREGRPLLLVAEPRGAAHDRSVMLDNACKLLDASVDLLLEQGFAVRRNPVPFAVTPDSGKRLPRLYNNVLLENAIRPGRCRPIVWLPCFGDAEPLEDYDLRNSALWEDLGFDVVAVPGWSHLASRHGALRCASKVLKRAPG